MTRSPTIQRLWITKTRPYLPTRLHLFATARCRLEFTLEHSRRSNQYQAYPTRLRSHDHRAINEYLAVSDKHPAVAGFLSSVAFVHGITGHKFTDRYLLLQALYGVPVSEHPHQRLALLGDTLLQYILKDDWFRLNLPTRRAGEIVSQVATNANLADVAKETGLVRHMSFLDPKIKERTNDHILGTIVEALLGAIHEDSGKDMEAVRRAMHLMGLSLPKWYMAKSLSNQPESKKARADLDQHDLQGVQSELDQPDLHQDRSPSDRIVAQNKWSLKPPSRRERKRRRELRHTPHDKVHRGLSEHNDLDEGSLGHRYQIAEEQATSDEDLEALDAAPERLYDMDTDAEICEDYGTEHAVLEDADSNQTHLGDEDADQTGLETSATHQGSIEPTDAGFTSSSWRQLMRRSGDSQRKLETAPRQGRAKPTAPDFDRAMEAIMLEESNSFPIEHELVGESEWPVRHGWYPQHCQITLDVATSKESNDKKEAAACKPDRQLSTSSLDVAPPGLPHTTTKVAAAELNPPMAALTLDDIALPPPHTTKEVAAYEPDRLRLIVAP